MNRGYDITVGLPEGVAEPEKLTCPGCNRLISTGRILTAYLPSVMGAALIRICDTCDAASKLDDRFRQRIRREISQRACQQELQQLAETIDAGPTSEHPRKGT